MQSEGGKSSFPNSSVALIRFAFIGLIALAACCVWLGSTFSPLRKDALAEGDGAAMALAVTSGGDCEELSCVVPSGESFTLAVEAAPAPPQYFLVQTYIDFGQGLMYQPTLGPGDEWIWPDCNPSIALRYSPGPTSVFHGCETGFLPPEPTSSYTGVLFEMTLKCVVDGSHEIQLLPFGAPPANDNGALFKDTDNSTIVPKISNLTVECGFAELGPTETSAPTATPPPFAPGDVDCDGSVSSRDAALLLQLSARLVNQLDCQDAGDVNRDGVVDALDASLVLQYSAGLIPELVEAG